MGRRNDHSREELHELALQAASDIVAKEGFQGLSARKIASRIGYSVGSLYLHFKNLDELILQVNSRNLEQLYQTVAEAGQSALSPEERLLAFCHAYLNFAEQNPLSWRMIFEHRMKDDAPLPDWFEEKVNALYQLIEQPISQLTESVGPQQRRAYATVLWSNIHGLTILDTTGKLAVVQLNSAHQLLEQMVQIYVAGMRSLVT